MTFSFASPHWSEKTTLNPGAGTKPFDGPEEIKLHTYWSTPITKLCLGMSLPTDIHWLEIQQSSASLMQVIAGEPLFIETSAGKEAWESLVTNSSSCPLCTIEGFNDKLTVSKIGFRGYSDSNCTSIQFYNAFGLTSFGCGSEDERPLCYIMIK